MHQKLLPCLLALIPALAAGCRDGQNPAGATSTLDQPAPAAHMHLPPDGGATYYSSTNTITHSGGLDGWDRADEYDARTFDDISEWNARTGSWDETQNYEANQQIEGIAESSAFDIGQGKKFVHTYVATLRSGATIADNGGPSLDLLPQNAPAALRTAPAPLLSLSSVAAARRANGNVQQHGQFSDDEKHAAQTDKRLATAGGAARELALLRRQFGQHTDEPTGEMHFSKAHDKDETHVYFDPQIGAVTRLEAFEGGHRASQTLRRYHSQGDVWVLDQVKTKLFDKSGNAAGEFTERISNVQAH